MTQPQPEQVEPVAIDPHEADENPQLPAKAAWNLSNRPFVVAAGVAAVLAVALVVTLVISIHPFAGGHDIDVTFTLTDDELGESCQGDGGYSDIGSGTPVRVTDGDGSLLGAGSLGEGAYFGGGCLWAVTIDGVKDADFYSVEIGGRGAISKSATELEGDDWTFDVSLG